MIGFYSAMFFICLNVWMAALVLAQGKEQINFCGAGLAINGIALSLAISFEVGP